MKALTFAITMSLIAFYKTLKDTIKTTNMITLVQLLILTKLRKRKRRRKVESLSCHHWHRLKVLLRFFMIKIMVFLLIGKLRKNVNQSQLVSEYRINLIKTFSITNFNFTRE